MMRRGRQSDGEAKANIDWPSITSAVGPVISAPPVLNARDDTIDYTSGKCGTSLLHAEEGEVHNLTIICIKCGSVMPGHW